MTGLLSIIAPTPLPSALTACIKLLTLSSLICLNDCLSLSNPLDYTGVPLDNDNFKIDQVMRSDCDAVNDLIIAGVMWTVVTIVVYNRV